MCPQARKESQELGWSWKVCVSRCLGVGSQKHLWRKSLAYSPHAPPWQCSSTAWVNSEIGPEFFGREEGIQVWSIVLASSVKQFDCCHSRFFMSKDQHIYGWWFHHLMSKVWPVFRLIHSKLAARSLTGVKWPSMSFLRAMFARIHIMQHI